MVTFIILRHGYSLFNKESRFSGQYNVDLDELGLRQAQDTAAYVLKNYKIDKIYSSDLQRALDTVEPIAKALGMPVEKSVKLRELDVGAWEGKTFEEVKSQYPEAFELYKTNVGIARPTDGESYAELIKRSADEMERLAKENEGKTVLVSTHGGFIRCLRCAWNNIPLEEVKNVPHVANASVSVAKYERGVGKFLILGYNEHLQDKVTEFKVN